MRDTSVEAYEFIRTSGQLSKKRWEVYEHLFKSTGSLTHGELTQIIEAKYHTVYGGQPRKFYRNNIVARLGELRDMGAVKETGTRKCKNSGHQCITWDVTAERHLAKLKKEQRIKCEHCDGRGYFIKENPNG